MRKIFIILFFFFILNAKEYYHLVKVKNVEKDKVLLFDKKGFVINGFQDGNLIMEVPMGREDEIKKMGYDYEILIYNVTKYYEDNFADARYHTYQEFLDTLNILARNFSHICRLETIGFSVQNRPIVVMRITDNPDREEYEPEILIEGNTHGDEKIGSEAAFGILRYLVLNYGVDPLVTQMVNNREIWISPVVNPDGHVSNSRYNANGVDLNRDYGYAWDTGWGSPDAFSQPETRAFRNLSARCHFSHWTSYHSGTLFISCPWSYSPFPPPDSALIIGTFAREYASFTGYPYAQGYHGMYEIHGCSKDYAYGVYGAISWTTEICYIKTPPADSIEPITNREIQAMKNLIIKIKIGIEGVIKDSITNEPIKALIQVDNFWPVYSDSVDGYFMRPLLPDTYTLKIMAPGYQTKIIENVISPSDTAIFLEIKLLPDPNPRYFGFITTMLRHRDNNVIPTFSNFALGYPDDRRISLGINGWIIIDMLKPILNQPGIDFLVYENDNDPEGYFVYVSQNWNGPFYSCGTDTGTGGFDLSRSGLNWARYIKILDDGDGSSSPTAGFDLDAIVAYVSSGPLLAPSLFGIVDTPPNGNGNNRAEPNEIVSLLFKIRNMGNELAESVYTILRTNDTFITIIDSITYFGNILPDSEIGPLDPEIFISSNTPPRRQTNFRLIMVARNYLDSATITIQTGGGTPTCPIPDNQYIYWAYDNSCSTYTECPRYEWIEIRNIGIRLPINQDDQTIRIKWPFGFKYYGVIYNDSLSVCSNGWITPMRTTLTAYNNQPLPDPTSQNPSAMICPNWDDLDARRGNGIWFLYDSLNRRIIIEWDSIHYFSPSAQWDKFQIIIYDSTVAGPNGYNKIVFQYKTKNGFTSSTIGIEDHTNTIGINYPQEGIIRERAIRFTNVWPQVVYISQEIRNQKEKFSYPTIIASQIKLNLEKEKEISLYNLSGSKVKTLKPKEKEVILDIKELPKGVYIIKFKENKKNLKVIKIK